MPQFDLDVQALRRYRYPRPAPADLDEFWTRTMAEATAAGGDCRADPVDGRLTAVRALDVTFPGFGGEPIRGWWLRPAAACQTGDRLPVVVEFLGYGGGRGRPFERLLWACLGYAQLVVDTRGQGSIWNPGVTPDGHGSAPAAPGFLTRGLDHPDNLYYRRLFTDAARAVDAAGALPGADPERIAVVGHSQGGAMALAAAALNPRVRACAARAPFLCGIARSVVMTASDPYSELGRYLAAHSATAEQALSVLDYVDGAFLAPRITCPVRYAVALMDDICPPSGIFAAVNATTAPTEVALWPYHGHDAGGAADDEQVADWLGGLL